jgi:hypothetical protein
VFSGFADIYHASRLEVAMQRLTILGDSPFPPRATVDNDARRFCLPNANCRTDSQSVTVTLRLAVYRQ